MAEKISHHVRSRGHEEGGHSGGNETENVSHTKVEFKSGVQPKNSSGLHDVSDGVESSRRLGNVEPLRGGDRVLELTSDLLSS